MTAGRDEGQSSVELALVLPLVVLVLLAVVQVAVVARDEVFVVHAAREAARAVAVDPRPGVADRAAASVVALKAGRLSTETSHRGGSIDIVTVVVRYRAPTDVPVVGRLLPDVMLEANAAMRDESGIIATGRG
ncbi:MAG TPA: TadE/TadG family type IV pilus assembly protein [Acidimicrobiales bacterium]|nr:TadE/TadG family type IV pilus assembly protein [Acidimicrobiales bacterium]